MQYIDVILPLPFNTTFTYSVPADMEGQVALGIRVLVPFGSKKMYSAIVCLLHNNPPTDYAVRSILSILDETPILAHSQLKFWRWIANYYCATLGEVYNVALPTGLKITSETRVCINPEFDPEGTFSEKEWRVLEVLSEGKIITVEALNKATKGKNNISLLRMLMERGAITVSEEVVEKYREKQVPYVRLAEKWRSEEALRKVFDDLARAQKQLKMLMSYISLSKCLQANGGCEVTKADLLQVSECPDGVLRALIDRGVLELYQKKVDRLAISTNTTVSAHALSEVQKEAFTEIKRGFQEREVVLLHGVTSSGKTDIYIHLINDYLAQQKQVLLLVPEIALTTQLTVRLQAVFGDKLGVYHSKFSDAERVEIWNNLLKNRRYEIIVGVRSSVFLPFHRLGLVIVDEEHENSYKQFDPAPRYHARDTAIVLASMLGAKTLLGTATPSIESYHNAEIGKYGLVTLDKRFEDMALPEIVVVDTKEAYRKKEMEGHVSILLKEKMVRALGNNEQVILFQNRRGYTPYIECKACAHVPKCQNCDVSLTQHKYMNVMSCHYCGFSQTIPQQCPVCRSFSFSDRGFGTEKIEDEIKALFPEAKVRRMDLDSTRGKYAYQKIINDFEQGKIDILIGTQMVSKGLDFDRVSLVGVLNADNLLNFPDFRAYEKTFQMLTQVSGRAGRKHKRGTVVLQTAMPDHNVIAQVINNDYLGMYKTQCQERQMYSYPPYARLIRVKLRHRDKAVLEEVANYFFSLLSAIFGGRIIGPNKPLIERIKNYYIKELLLKIEVSASVQKAKELLAEQTVILKSVPKYKQVTFQIDVDPG